MIQFGGGGGNMTLYRDGNTPFLEGFEQETISKLVEISGGCRVIV